MKREKWITYLLNRFAKMKDESLCFFVLFIFFGSREKMETPSQIWLAFRFSVTFYTAILRLSQ